MPTDLRVAGNSEAHPRYISAGELIDRVRDELALEFAWPPSMLPLTRPLQDLAAAIDPVGLAEAATAANNKKNLTFTVVSKE